MASTSTSSLSERSKGSAFEQTDCPPRHPPTLADRLLVDSNDENIVENSCAKALCPVVNWDDLGLGRL